MADSDSASDNETAAVRHMIRQVNKKKKKSGGFQSMGLSQSVFRGITRIGYKIPTPIQRKTIPLILDGTDVVAMARTGSGKTAAFLIPLFEKLKKGGGGAMGGTVTKVNTANVGARALIMSPTRELALQTLKFTRDLGAFTGLRTALILGGDSMDDQFEALHKNPDIVIATPGRFLHVVMEMNLRLSSIEYVVFDEADRLFEMGFLSQLEEIIGRLPEGRQTLLFSATLPGQVIEFAKAGLHQPTLLRLDVDTKISPNLQMSFYQVRACDKAAVLIHYLKYIVKPEEQTVVFLATKHHVELLTLILEKAGIKTCCVYSSLHPTARKISIGQFQHKKVKVMLVTDLAARGIDIPMLDHVVNFHFPAKGKLYVHRVGRVARAGRSGTAVSFVAPDEMPYLLDLLLFIDKNIKFAGDDSTPGGDSPPVFGRVPQSVVDGVNERVKDYESTSFDITSQMSTCENAYKQYIRSRPKASPESSKRAKEMAQMAVGIHPSFESGGATSQESYLDVMKSYRPKTTIFEINATAKSVGNKVMQQRKAFIKRRPVPYEKPVGPFRRKVTPGESTFKDEDNFVPYMPANFSSEKGLSVKSGFDQQAASSSFEILGDENKHMRRMQANQKWDRKKKKFVNESSSQGKQGKKMVTESGHILPASYKSKFYQDWLGKSKANEVEVSEVAEEEKNFRKMEVFGHKLQRHQKGSEADKLRKDNKKELKTKDQILKARRTKAKKAFQMRAGHGKKGSKGSKKRK